MRAPRQSTRASLGAVLYAVLFAGCVGTCITLGANYAHPPWWIVGLFCVAFLVAIVAFFNTFEMIDESGRRRRIERAARR